MRAAKGLGAKIIRFALTPVLCGDRNAAGEKWPELVANVRDEARRLRAEGRRGTA